MTISIPGGFTDRTPIPSIAQPLPLSQEGRSHNKFPDFAGTIALHFPDYYSQYGFRQGVGGLGLGVCVDRIPETSQAIG
jgi:hypothetical protein